MCAYHRGRELYALGIKGHLDLFSLEAMRAFQRKSVSEVFNHQSFDSSTVGKKFLALNYLEKFLIFSLLFDSTDFYARILDVINTAFSPNPVLSKQHQENLEKALSVMETFLEGNEFFVGNNVTIADFPFCASIATLTNFGFDISSFGNVSAWYERMKELKGYDQVLSGAQEFGAIIKSSLKNSFSDFN